MAIGVPLVFLALSIALTWPLAAHLTDRIPHDLGDPLLLTYLLSWNATVVPLSGEWWNPPFFWPARGAIVFSDHLLGLSLFATPLQWLGAGPVTAYNVLFIASFWLCGVSAWVLTRALTGSELAGLIGGLAYMLAPYRLGQLPHLQMLMTPAIPIAFYALHRARDTHRRRWALLAATCWIWQGLVGGYHLFFVPVAMLVWLLWFAWRDWRLWRQVGAAMAAGAIAIAPLLLAYSRTHHEQGYRRVYGEVARNGADLAALGQSSPLRVIAGTREGNRTPEQDLFPGFGILLLSLIGVATIGRSAARAPLAARGLAVLAIALAVIGIAAIAGGGELRLAGLTVPVRSPHKPLGLAWALAAMALLASRTMREAWRRRSMPAGYALMALTGFALALGPEPRVNGHEFWYRAPYWLLYSYVPGFDALRVPVRFWTIVVFGLAVLAGLGGARLLSSRRLQPLAAILAAAVVVEGWLATLPLHPLPARLAIPSDAEVVLELPVHDTLRDLAAMYRSIEHRRPVINGYSGYYADGYSEFAKRVDGGSSVALREAARGRRLAVVVDVTAPDPEFYVRLAREQGAVCTPGTPGTEAIVCLLDGR